MLIIVNPILFTFTIFNLGKSVTHLRQCHHVQEYKRAKLSPRSALSSSNRQIIGIASSAFALRHFLNAQFFDQNAVGHLLEHQVAYFAI